MTDQHAATTEVVLTGADAHELAELLVFVHDWLTTSQDSDLLAASLDRFPDSTGKSGIPPT